MSLTAITIVLDGIPWLPIIYSNLLATRLDWRWIVIEGVALPVADSSHCRTVPERLSVDGTSQFMEWAARNPRVTYLRQTSWQGKIEMVNTAVDLIKEPCLLMQMDSDEIWRPDMLEKVHMLSEDWPIGGSAKFHCRYFLGPDIVATGTNCYGNYDHEWIRAWSYQSPMRFDTHCPPVLDGNRAAQMSRDATKRMGITFDHMAWATEAQARFKEQYYGYEGALQGWKRLQVNTEWPTPLKEFFPWVDEKAMADKIWS